MRRAGSIAPGFTPLLRLLTLLLAVLLAACSSAPQRTVRGSAGGASSTAGAYRTPPGFPHFVDHSIGREEISIQAMSLVGVPYRWGGNTPDAGFDCSGLVHYVVQRAASVNLPRTTADMSSRGTSIAPDEIAAGDLVFFNTTGRPHSHVGIYVGKLRFVNAPSTGGTVRLDYLTNPYWAKHFDGIRRVAPPLAPSKPTPFDEPTYEAAAPKANRAVSETAGVALAAPGGASVGAPGTAPLGAAAEQTPLTAQRDSRVAAARAPESATTATTAAGAPAAGSTDAFEPPPSAMSAAQSQARAAGAVSPAVTPAPESAPAPTPPVTASARAPDAIDAAADAYEPPPSSAIAAARQAQAAQRTPQAAEWQRPAPGGSVQIMRASTDSRGVPASTQTNDDPIAGFANSSY